MHDEHVATRALARTAAHTNTTEYYSHIKMTSWPKGVIIGRELGVIRIETLVQKRFTHNFLREHIPYLVSFERALQCGQFQTTVICAKRTARIKRAITQSIVNSSFLAITWRRGHNNLLNLADSCHVYGYMCLPSFIDVGIKIAGLEQVEVISQFS